VKRFLCLALAVAPASSQVTIELRSEIAVYYRFQHEPQSSVWEALEQETSSILLPMGEVITWQAVDGGSEAAANTELAVLTFIGNCGSFPRGTREFGLRALGLTHISNGEILPFSDIDCDRIHGLVDGWLAGLQSSERDVVFGRAVGRVVAHELYHIVANTAQHADEGVGKATFTTQELTSDEFRFQEPALDPSAVPPGAESGGLDAGRQLLSPCTEIPDNWPEGHFVALKSRTKTPICTQTPDKINGDMGRSLGSHCCAISQSEDASNLCT